jgi:hypothetical protein
MIDKSHHIDIVRLLLSRYKRAIDILDLTGNNSLFGGADLPRGGSVS